MKTHSFNNIAVKQVVLAIAIASGSLFPLTAQADIVTAQQNSSQLNTVQTHMQEPRVQIAILLDTSGSMDGLINQTRAQLWQMVDEFSKAKKNGVQSILEVAVFEYGNAKLSPQNGYIRQLTGLTRDLDKVSEALFSLTTDGGDEYCGYVIDTATKQLQWSHSDNDVKAIFIAGNEPFTQGPVLYSEAINQAKARGITVNTIFAGEHSAGFQNGWQQGAVLAGGDYMSINHNQKIAHVVAPQDQRIAELNQQLNQTYVPYGQEGEVAVKRQQEQDKNSRSISPGMLAERAKSKVSSAYNTSSWDLVEALEEGEVQLDNVAEESLPAPMVSMSTEEKNEYIKSKSNERATLKKQIADLSKDREEFVAGKKREAAESEDSTVSDALSAAIRKQGEGKSFEFK